MLFSIKFFGGFKVRIFYFVITNIIYLVFPNFEHFCSGLWSFLILSTKTDLFLLKLCLRSWKIEFNSFKTSLNLYFAIFAPCLISNRNNYPKPEYNKQNVTTQLGCISLLMLIEGQNSLFASSFLYLLMLWLKCFAFTFLPLNDSGDTL